MRWSSTKQEWYIKKYLSFCHTFSFVVSNNCRYQSTDIDFSNNAWPELLKCVICQSPPQPWLAWNKYHHNQVSDIQQSTGVEKIFQSNAGPDSPFRWVKLLVSSHLPCKNWKSMKVLQVHFFYIIFFGNKLNLYEKWRAGILFIFH